MGPPGGLQPVEEVAEPVDLDKVEGDKSKPGDPVGLGHGQVSRGNTCKIHYSHLNKMCIDPYDFVSKFLSSVIFYDSNKKHTYNSLLQNNKLH